MKDDQIKYVEEQLARAKTLREKLKGLSDLNRGQAIQSSITYHVGGMQMTVVPEIVTEIVKLGIAELMDQTRREFERMEITSTVPVPVPCLAIS